ncbi:hypothetical protein [Ruania rhizosphaerae]|uniref:hypothetical protein n=1 Tax=Ruania rhizosphaerae TaxID=1840413 RepID=UPI001359DF12|nr:hypothetical protein [Ruania rhizosphaerae]
MAESVEIDSVSIGYRSAEVGLYLSTHPELEDLHGNGIGYPANRSQLAVVAGEALADLAARDRELGEKARALRDSLQAVADAFPDLDIELAQGESGGM